MSFNIRTDFTVPGQDLLGYDHLNLNNGFHDPTFIREYLTYLICRRHGVAPKCNFVKLYLNGTFWGVYINVQQPNKDMMKEWFRSNDGNRYRGFPTTGNFQNGRCALTWLGNNVNSYLDAYRAKEGDGTDLMQLCNVLNNTPTALMQTTVPAIFSVDQFYRYAACMNIVTQTDSYIGSGKDHFLYHDDVYGAFHMFPFDVNEAFAGNSSLSPWHNTGSSIKPAYSKTLPIANWSDRYLAHYRNILEETFSWAELGPIIMQAHTMIAADVAADTKKIYTTQQFNDNITQPVQIAGGGGGGPGGGGPGGGGPGGGTVTVPALQTLIQNRNSWLTGRPDMSTPRAVLSQLQHTPADPNPSQSVVVTVAASIEASAISLFHRNSGAFLSVPMFDDGLHGDGAAADGIWGASLPPTSSGTIVDYYVSAATNTGDLSFSPSTAEHKAPWYRVGWPTTPSAICINEFLAKNNTVVADQAGEYEDYVELFNNSNQAVAVGGMYLTDDLSNPTKWQLPTGQVISAFDTLLVWCDEDGSQGPLHANFKLSSDGEEIALFDPSGGFLLDSTLFGTQLADISTGRLYDGGSDSVTFMSPTPSASNELSGCGVRAYSAQDSSLHDITLDAPGGINVGQTATFEVRLAPAASTVILAAAAGGGLAPIYATQVSLLLSADVAPVVVLPADGNGAVDFIFSIPNIPGLAGFSAAIQTFALEPSSIELHASNAVEIVICP
jgi:hypothetical protein